MRKTHVHYKNKDEVIYELIKANPYIKNCELAEKLNMSIQTASRSTQALKESGRIAYRGNYEHYVVDDHISHVGKMVSNDSVKNSIMDCMKIEKIAIRCYNPSQFEEIKRLIPQSEHHHDFYYYGSDHDSSYDDEYPYIKFSQGKFVSWKNGDGCTVITYDQFMDEYKSQKCDAPDMFPQDWLNKQDKNNQTLGYMMADKSVWVKNRVSCEFESMYEKAEECNVVSISTSGVRLKRGGDKDGDRIVLFNVEDVYFTQEECQQAIDKGE